MSDTQAMSTDRFLQLLNKADRTPEEEQELQAELVRQAKANQPEQPVSDTPATPEAQAGTTEPTTAEVPVEATSEPTVQPEAEGYTLEQLEKELQDAIDFLNTKERTLAREMGVASLTQARYWINLANKGE